MSEKKRRFSEFESLDHWAEENPEEWQDVVLVGILGRHPNGLTTSEIERLAHEWFTDHVIDEMAEDGLVRRLDDGSVVLTEKGWRA